MAENVAHIIKKIALALFYILIYFSILYLLTVQVALLEEDVKNYSEVVTIIASVASVGIYLVTFYFREVKVKRYIKFKRVSLIEAVLSLTMAVGFRILTGAYLMWSQMSVPVLQRSIENAQQSYNFNTMTTFCAISVVLSVCVVAPVFEEILFRGIVLKELGDAMPAAAAIVFQALLFGISHAVLAQSIFAAVYGIILGAVYLKCRNISVVILAHMFFNMSSVLEVKNAEMLTEMFITGLVLTGLSIIIFFYIYRRKKPAYAGEVTGGNDNV